MNNQLKKAFDFAADATKQMITLASGIITITVTFAKDFLTSSKHGVHLVMIAWCIYLVSIVMGLMMLLSMTAQLEPKGETAKTPTIWSPNATLFSTLQIVCFVAGTCLIVLFGVRSYW